MATPFHVVQRATELPVPAEEVYKWHTRPGALERLTPPWDQVEVVEGAGGVEDGGRVTLRVHVGPVARSWVARYRDVHPGRQFVDEQIEGPFSHWVHTHRMEPLGPDASRLVDHIEFMPPFGTLGAAAGLWIVKPRLERLLAWRHATTAEDLAVHDRWRDEPRRHVLVSGASGLVGTALGPFLTTQGHRVTRLVRRAARADEIRWDPDHGLLDAAQLDGIDAIVHLAGASIADGRWTDARRQLIRDSRRQGTRLLSETIARLERKPAVLVSASALGIYGDRADEILDENSSPGDGFLADVCREWEAATRPAAEAGVRVVHVRFGVILSPAGGALRKMLLPFRLGLGGPLGPGTQWMSWISIDDAIGAIHHIMMTPTLAGPVNVVGPEPVTNRAFARTLGEVVHRPAIAAVPAPLLRAFFGEMAEATVLASQRGLPRRLLDSGYRFRHPTLGAALSHVLGRGDQRPRSPSARPPASTFP
ncbi:MAG: TIGR01777 family oxidoreductase [Gemmatimonadota bacterium]